MNDVFCLDRNYSTTRRVTRTSPIYSRFVDTKFDLILTLAPSNGPKGEGGLRTNRYFKAGKYLGQETGANTIPLVTIITAVFNGEKTLEKTIQSVLSQSYSNIEFIVIDGGSTDGTIDIIRKYEHAIDYWVSEADNGIYDAWNKGVILSTGSWIAFLGADDAYLDGAVQSYVACVENDHGGKIEYISSRVNLTDGLSTLRVVGRPWNWMTFRKYMNVAHVGSLHNRRLFEKYGLFDTTYKISGDYEFLLRSGAGLRAHFLDAVTVNMLVGGVSDANFLVFQETTKAKIATGNRSFPFAYIEKYWAILKWKIRGYLRG